MTKPPADGTALILVTAVVISVWAFSSPSNVAAPQADGVAKEPDVAAEPGTQKPRSLHSPTPVGIPVEEGEAATGISAATTGTAQASPSSLLPSAAWKGTRENFLAWYADVPAVAEVDLESIPYDAELARLWELCREQQAFLSYCLAYQGREIERWRAGETSIAFEDELRPVYWFITDQFGDDPELWEAINVYSHEALEHVRKWGVDTDQRSRPESWNRVWEALRRSKSKDPWNGVHAIILKGAKR